MNIGLITDKPDHPVLLAMIQLLQVRHHVTVLNLGPGSNGIGPAREAINHFADVYLLKAHSHKTLAYACELELYGAAVIPEPASTLATFDREAMADTLKTARIASPPTWSLASVDDLSAEALPAGLQFPFVIKSRYSRSGDLVRKVHDSSELGSLRRAWGREPVVAQEFVSNDGIDRKLWVVGREVFAGRRRTPLDPAATKDTFTIPPDEIPDEWLSIARRIGAAFRLDLYGFDLLQTAGGTTVVDVNPFPGYRGVLGAPEALATFTENRLRDHEVTA